MVNASPLFILAIALIFQNASGVYFDEYDCIPPWARVFLAWRQANTNVAGSHFPPLSRITRFYSTPVRDPIAPCLGGLLVTSISNGPIGIIVRSENIIEGPLASAGELPFLGTVALGGALPTVGSGSAAYSTDGPNAALLATTAGSLDYNRFNSLRYLIAK